MCNLAFLLPNIAKRCKYAGMALFLRLTIKKSFLQCCFSFLICMYSHAPQQWLVCCHHYWLPWVSMGNRFIGVGGAYQFSKLQDLVICGGQEKRFNVFVWWNEFHCWLEIVHTLCSKVVRAVFRSTWLWFLTLSPGWVHRLNHPHSIKAIMLKSLTGLHFESSKDRKKSS